MINGKTLSHIAIALLLIGCQSASITSNQSLAGTQKTGIRYYLPTAYLQIPVRAGFIHRRDEIELALLDARVTHAEIQPDVSREYGLQYKPSAFADDHLCVSISAKGLLSSVQIVTADRSGDVLVRIAETAAVIASGGAIPPPEGAGFLEEGEELIWDDEPFITIAFDPRNEKQRAFVQTAIKSALATKISAFKNRAARRAAAGSSTTGMRYKVAEDISEAINSSIEIISVSLSESSLQTTAPSAQTSGDGIFVRTSTPRLVSVSPILGPTRVSDMLIPDENSTSLVSLERAFAVRKSYDLVLADGVLTKFEVNKPSEALAVASLPLEVAGAVIEAPARFFTAISRSFQSKSAILKARADLIAAETEFEKVRSGENGSVPQVSPPSGEAPSLASNRTGPTEFTSGMTCTTGND